MRMEIRAEAERLNAKFSKWVYALPEFTTSCHLDKTSRTFQTHRQMPTLTERLEVAPGAAAKVENIERRSTFDELQQCVHVLLHIVVACAGKEVLGILVVVVQRAQGGFTQGIRW